MKEQKEFKLVEKGTKEKEDGEHLSFKYSPVNADDEKDITISVKKESLAKSLGLPTESIGDTILIEFGVTNKQEKIKE